MMFGLAVMISLIAFGWLLAGCGRLDHRESNWEERT